MKIIPDRFTHYYLPTGQPYWEVPKKDGSGVRPVTIADARKAGAYPSVTEILRVVAKPELEQWKIEQAILAALTLPRIENEPLEAFARRVAVDAEAQSQNAMSFGRRIHKALENYPALPEDEIAPFVAAAFEWMRKEVEFIHGRETVVVNREMGYAGTFDLRCNLRGIGPAVCDFKSQSIKNGKPIFYDDWGLQLSAYSRAVHQPGEPLPVMVSIVINSKEPGPIFCEQWKEPERHWEAFCAAFDLWKYQKKYEPVP